MTQIIIVKTSEGGNTSQTAFLISNLNSFNWDVNPPVTPMPLPEDTHESNILVKMEGNSAQLSVSWTMTKGSYFGTFDSSNNSFTANSETLTSYEQITRFKEEFIPTFIQDGYSMFVLDETTNNVLLNDDGTMTTIRFDVSGQSPVVWNASLQFMVGDVVSLFEADVPPRPRSVNMSQPNTSVKEIKVEWVEFTEFATSADAIETTGVEIHYKFNNDIWKKFTNSDLITSEQAVGLGSGASGSSVYSPIFRTFTVSNTGKYKIKVALLSEKSDEAGIRLPRRGTELGTLSDKVLVVV